MKTLRLRFPKKLCQVHLFHLPPTAGGLSPNPQEGAGYEVARDPILERVQQEQMEREAVQRVFQSLERTLPQLGSLVEKRLDQWAPYVLDLGLRLAGEALGRELEAGNYDLVPTIREALSQAVGAGEGSLQVFLHPQDLGRVIERMGEDPAERGEALKKEVEYKVDPSVQLGACRIESNHGRIVHDPRAVLESMVQKILGELGS